jgi:hypothetical protein
MTRTIGHASTTPSQDGSGSRTSECAHGDGWFRPRFAVGILSRSDLETTMELILLSGLATTALLMTEIAALLVDALRCQA